MNREIINQVYKKYAKKLEKIAKDYNSKITSYRNCGLHAEAKAMEGYLHEKADKLNNKLIVLNLLLEVEKAEDKEKIKKEEKNERND